MHEKKRFLSHTDIIYPMGHILPSALCWISGVCGNLSIFIFSTHFRHRSQHYSRAYGQLGDRRHIRHPALWDIRSSAARHHMAERSGANQSSPVHSHTCLSTLLTKKLYQVAFWTQIHQRHSRACVIVGLIVDCSGLLIKRGDICSLISSVKMSISRLCSVSVSFDLCSMLFNSEQDELT